MTDTPCLTRQEHLQKLKPFCQALAEAVRRSGLAPEQSLDAFRFLSADCVQCATRVPGEQLFTLCQRTDPPGPSPRLQRLHQGYCASEGCNSFYYRLTFQPHPTVDWTTLLSQIDVIQDELAGSDSVTKAQPAQPARDLGKMFFGSGIAWRFGAGLLALALFLLIRQLYYGGRIPILREPEHFRVTSGTNEVSIPPD